MPSCEIAPALYNRPRRALSTPLTPDMIAWADLVLSADRENQAAVATLDPSARTKAFTIRQAGRLSEWLLGFGMVEAARFRAAYPDRWAMRFEEGDPRAAVLPMPATKAEKVDWMVRELDAARGIAPLPVTGPELKPNRWWRRASEPTVVTNVIDVDDAHLGVGEDTHHEGYLQMQEATTWLARALAAVEGSVVAGEVSRPDQEPGQQSRYDSFE